jgi:hypothetical protein
MFKEDLFVSKLVSTLYLEQSSTEFVPSQFGPELTCTTQEL